MNGCELRLCLGLTGVLSRHAHPTPPARIREQVGVSPGLCLWATALSWEHLVTLRFSVRLGALFCSPQLPGGLKQTYDFVDYLAFFPSFFSLVSFHTLSRSQNFMRRDQISTWNVKTLEQRLETA